MRYAAFALPLLAACVGVEAEVRQARIGDAIQRMFMGKRNVAYHIRTIERAVTMPEGDERYRYKGRANVSHYRVVESVRQLGAALPRSLTELTNAVDPLLFVVAHDPTGEARRAACVALGQVALRLPVSPGWIPTHDPRTPAQIVILAAELKRYQRRIESGKQVEEAKIVIALQRLAALEPADRLTARRVVRAVGARPIGGSRGAVRREAERLVPPLVRRCILVVLASVVAGDAAQPGEAPDPTAWVRAEAAMILARFGSPVARSGVLRRLADPVYPAERDPDTRRALLRYLTCVPDAQVFEICVRCLDDLERGVRYDALRALREITRAAEPSTAPEWRAWREKHPEWRVLPQGAPSLTGEREGQVHDLRDPRPSHMAQARQQHAIVYHPESYLYFFRDLNLNGVTVPGENIFWNRSEILWGVVPHERQPPTGLPS